MKFGAAIQRRFHRHLPAAAGAGPRHHRRLQAPVEDRTDQGYEALDSAMKAEVRGQGDARTPSTRKAFSPDYKINEPQLNAELDRTKAHATRRGRAGRLRLDADLSRLGLLHQRLSIKFGRTYQVIAQADKAFRSRKAGATFSQLKTRSADGRDGAVRLDHDRVRHDGPRERRCTTIRLSLGRPERRAAAPGYSSGQAQAAMDHDS